MFLRQIIGRDGLPNPYTEFGWVCAPNFTYQTCPANVISQLYMNTVVTDGGFGTLTPNSWVPPAGSASTYFTLPRGIYAYEIITAAAAGGTTSSGILGLYNQTANRYVSRVNASNGHVSYGNYYLLTGQMSLVQESSFHLTFMSYYVSYIMSGVYNATVMTNSTPNADQRTTVKLWKLDEYITL